MTPDRTDMIRRMTDPGAYRTWRHLPRKRPNPLAAFAALGIAALPVAVILLFFAFGLSM